MITSSCREKTIDKEVNKCDSNPCLGLSGFDCVDGACLCPQGKFKIGTYCGLLNINEYYGTSTCNNLDTIKIDFGQSQQIDERIASILTTKTFATQMNGLRYKGSSQNQDSVVLYFPRTYMKDTIECRITAAGRFLDKTKLKLNLKYYAINQNSRFVESCEMILQR